MSFFTNIVRNVKEFYSEINAATLTGAIDVIVVEQEDGTFKSSPFHVRFGKLGVLKAKEKIVDLEINGEPVHIQMKLDDTGAAFFVEDVASSDDSWNVELATSPIPEQGPANQFGFRERKGGSLKLKPTRLFDDVDGKDKDTLEDVTESPHKLEEKSSSSIDIRTDLVVESRKGKLNKKKRRRRQLRHQRRGSRTSLKEFVLETESLVESTDDMFDMDDVNDADQEDEMGGSEPECGSSSVPKSLNLDFLKSIEFKRTESTSSDQVIENSLIGARVPLIPKSTSEAEALEALFVPETFRPKSVSPGFHYFSDGEGGSRGGHSHLDPPAFQIDRPSTPGILSDSEIDIQKTCDDQNVWRWGELPNTSPMPSPLVQAKEEEDVKTEEKAKETEKRSWFAGWSNKSEVKQEPGGVYLDDIVDNPDLQAIYLKPIKTEPVDPLDISDVSKSDLASTNSVDLSDVPRAVDVPRDDDCESGNGPSLPMSPHSLIGVPGGARYDSDCEAELNRNCETDLPTLISRHLPDLAASLCGGLADATITPEQFEAHHLTYPQFLEKLSAGASVVNDANLVIRVHEKYLTWEKAAPILLSVMLFEQPLPSEVVSEITKDGLNVNINISGEEAAKKEDGDESGRKTSSWFGWFGGGPRVEDIKKEKVDEVEDFSSQTENKENTSTPRKTRLDTENNSTSSEDSDAVSDSKRFRKTLRLSSERLAEMKLKKGSNEIEFSVTTAFQGTTRCKCHIYLWHHTDKVVISDIDGTITKSDVLGHILPVIGRDWAQSGVAQLFTKIHNNGYQIMYLSARAIGQASITKDYLQSVKQGDVCLPDGPIFLNPDSLIHAFRREVIDRNPEEFKIRCLKDIQSLFEEKNPFFAGYGNRPNDAYAYRAVGIPVSRIFTINPAGELRHELTQNFQTSYTEQDAMVDLVFPPVGKDGFDPEFKIQEFSSFGFWREGFQEIDPESLDLFLGKDSDKK